MRGSFAISPALVVICRPRGLRMKDLIRFNKPAITFSSGLGFVVADVPAAGAVNRSPADPHAALVTFTL